MARVLLAVDFDVEARMLPGIIEAGHEILDRVAGAEALIEAVERLAPDIVVLSASPDTLGRESLSACERAGSRPVAVVATQADAATARALGLLETIDAGAGWAQAEEALRGRRSAASPWAGAATTVIPDDLAVDGGHPGASGPEAPSRRQRRAELEGRQDRRRFLGRRRTAPDAQAAPIDGPAGAPSAGSSSAVPARDTVAGAPGRRPGRIVAVWGTHGSPGATTVALALAGEAAGRGARVVLVDADTYGGSVAPLLGLGDEAPGFAAACRLAGAGSLTPAELDRIAAGHGAGRGGFRVLTGIPNPARWPELSRERALSVLRLCREVAELVIVDVGFSLETDEEIAADQFSPRRNAATHAALELADRVVAVSGADAVALQRFLRARVELVEQLGATPVDVVVNRVRSAAVGLGAASQVREVLARFAGIADPILVPLDQSAADRAIAAAAPITEASPRSGASRALRQLADRVWGPGGPSPRGAGRSAAASAPHQAGIRARSAHPAGATGA